MRLNDGSVYGPGSQSQRVGDLSSSSNSEYNFPRQLFLDFSETEDVYISSHHIQQHVMLDYHDDLSS